MVSFVGLDHPDVTGWRLAAATWPVTDARVATTMDALNNILAAMDNYGQW